MKEQRKILFRGKRTDNGKWVEGCLEYQPVTKLAFIKTPRHIYWDVNMVDPSTVSQYTGLRDKNGKRIFEGDILHGHIDCLSAEPDRVGRVEWGNYGWIICFNQPEWRIPRVGFGSFADYEVIGNIHDNPELLEESK